MEKEFEIDSTFKEETEDGKKTFVGVLLKYFHLPPNSSTRSISADWNENTQKQYINDYNKRLIPNLLDHNKKPLENYVLEDLITAINKIDCSDEKTKAHYTLLFRKVYEAGVDAGLYENRIDFLTKGILQKQEYSAEKAEKTRKTICRIRKRFDFQEEASLISYFKKNIFDKEDASDVDGEIIGLMQMFLFGLRNNESCGLTFDKIQKIKNVPFIIVAETTKMSSNEIVASGKTGNSPRIIPAFETYFNFIERRKKALEKILGKDFRLSIPIVCKERKYTEGCSASNLTDSGQKLFEELNINKSELDDFLREKFFVNSLYNVDYSEKDPTTYLFRRNYATHLYALGLSSSEIQYCIGHELDDPLLKRNFFSNEDYLLSMARKMNKHPFRLLLGEKVDSEEIIKFPSSSEDKSIHKVRIFSKEPNDKITIYTRNNKYLSVFVRDIVCAEGLSKTVSVANSIFEYYMKRLEDR